MPIASAPARVLRVTPMMVLPDIGEALSRYEALGFERVDTGSDGCVGMRAGQTGVILASVAFMNDDFDAIHTDRLLDKTIKYVHVSSIAAARSHLSSGATVLQDVWTRGGTRELLVEDAGDLLILAEKVA